MGHMKKILSFLFTFILGVSSLACAQTGTNPQARNITVDTSSFSKDLNNTDTDVQKALNTLDKVLGNFTTVNWGAIAGLLSNQTDLQNVLNSKISGVNWGQIGGIVSSQSDLNKALNGKAATSITVN